MLQFLFHPNTFFVKKKNQKANYKYPLIIMGIMMFFSLISTRILMGKIELTIYDISLTLQQITLMGLGLALVTLEILVKWILLTLIFFVLSYFLDGNNTIGRLFEFTSYGFGPLIFAYLLDIIFSAGIFYSSLDSSPGNTIVLETSILSNPYAMASNIITSMFLIWSAIIWIYAVYHCLNISFKKAIIIVSIPVNLYIFYIMSFFYQYILDFLVYVKHLI